MATHNHLIVDTDNAYIIDPKSKAISKVADGKIALMQYDHQSERFTFEVPISIEGHDMSKTDCIEIHWVNTGTGTSSSVRQTESGMYPVPKDAISITEDKSNVRFSWLIKDESTQLAGSLSFQIAFVCEGEGPDDPNAFRWSTDIYAGITIKPGYNNSAAIVERNPDVIAQIWARLNDLEENADAVDPTFTIEGSAADAKLTGDRLNDLEAKMDELLYKPLTINSFSHNSASTLEIGTVITSITLTWSLSKKPTALVVDGENQPLASSGSLTRTGLSITKSAQAEWIMSATGERGERLTKKTSTISFLNGVYYGASTVPAVYDRYFILKLNHELRSDKKPSFTAPGEGKYAFYCLPTRLGTCKFTVNGFTGGFTLVDTIAFENSQNYIENYYIYKSNNQVGSNTIYVS